MLYKEDWDRVQKKFLEYWNKENHDRPLISITAAKNGHSYKKVPVPEKLEDRWMDTEYMIKRQRAIFEGTFFGAEAFPNAWPNLGPDIFGAILGDEIEFGDDTSWSKHLLENLSTARKFEFDPDNKWWKKIREMTQTIEEDSNGDYFVGITDLHAGADGLVSLRGPENLCLDLYDHPEEVKRALIETSIVFKTVFDKLNEITNRKQKGSSNWMGAWHPKKWYVSSCDFMGMISPAQYKEFIEEELLLELEWMDASIFHLDGVGALKHLDALLEIPKINGIQWVYGAGQPSASHWIPVLKKIQDAGKLIHISCVPSDIDALLKYIKPEGLLLNISPEPEDHTGGKPFTQQQALDIIKKIENSYKRKLF